MANVNDAEIQKLSCWKEDSLEEILIGVSHSVSQYDAVEKGGSVWFN